MSEKSAGDPIYYTHDYNQDRVYGTDGPAQALTGVRRNYMATPDPQTKTGEQHSLQLTSSAADSPARTSRWPDAVLDSLASGQGYGMSFIESLARLSPVGFSLRTSLVCSPATEERTWPYFSGGWKNSGMGGPTGCLTLNTSEWPRDAAVCSLSDILETPGPHLERYFLSARACRGILRRAAKRGKELPDTLRRALEATAQGSAPCAPKAATEAVEAKRS